jgi:hypothetical protein
MRRAMRCEPRGMLASLFEAPTDPEPSPEKVSEWFANWHLRGWVALAPGAEVEDFPLVRHHSVRDIDWNRIDKMGSQARVMED